MLAYSCYLFDLDGTLVDSAPDIAGAVNRALAEFGYPPTTVSLVREWIGQGSRVLLRKAFAAAGADPEEPHTYPAGALDLFLDYYDQHIADHSHLYPQVFETLEALWHQGAVMGVVTNKFLRLADPLLKALDIRRFIGTVVGGSCAARPKPHADPILLACARLEADPRQTLMVGDTPIDQAAAHAAGCAYLQVPHGYPIPPPAGIEQASPVRYLSSFGSLLEAGRPGA